MPDKVVLVTGASGFIGRQVLHPLIKLGYKVHGVFHKQHPDVPDVQWHACNLLDTPDTNTLLASTRPSHLLHTAWYTEHGKYWTAPENTAWLDASTHLFERFIAQGGQRILGVGRCAEYDWQRQDKTPWKETDPCWPLTPYGQAKLALLQRLAAMPVSSYAWARVFMLFGPDEKPQRLVSSVVRAALADGPVLCTEGSQVRDFIDTGFCGEALAAVLHSGVTGPINIGSGDVMSIADLVKLVCELCNYTGEIKFGAIVMNKNEPAFLAPDLTRLHNEVKFAQQQDIRHALSKIIAAQQEPLKSLTALHDKAKSEASDR